MCHCRSKAFSEEKGSQAKAFRDISKWNWITASTTAATSHNHWSSFSRNLSENSKSGPVRYSMCKVFIQPIWLRLLLTFRFLLHIPKSSTISRKERVKWGRYQLLTSGACEYKNYRKVNTCCKGMCLQHFYWCDFVQLLLCCSTSVSTFPSKHKWMGNDVILFHCWIVWFPVSLKMKSESNYYYSPPGK